MDRQSKDRKIRTSSSKGHRTNSISDHHLQSASSKPKCLQQMIKQNQQGMKELKQKRDDLIKDLEKIKDQKQSQFKQKMISTLEQALKTIEEGIVSTQISNTKLMTWRVAELNISDVALNFQKKDKKKKESNKGNIGSKMKEFVSEDQEQE